MILQEVADFRKWTFEQRLLIWHKKLDYFAHIVSITTAIIGFFWIFRPELIKNPVFFWISLIIFVFLVVLITFLMRYKLDDADRTLCGNISEFVSGANQILSTNGDFQNIKNSVINWTDEDKGRDVKYEPDHLGKFFLFVFTVGILASFISFITLSSIVLWTIFAIATFVILIATRSDNISAKIQDFIQKDFK